MDAIAEKDLLLCLDNLEQLLDAAPFVGDLLARCPGLRLLVTSRSPLKLAGEREYPLPPLQADEALELFAARARAVAPDFAFGRARGDDPRDLRAARPAAARARAGRRPRAPALAAGTPLASRTGAPAAHRRRPRPPRAPADAPRRDRLELPAARRRTSNACSARFPSSSAASTSRRRSALSAQDELELLDPLSALIEHSLVRRREQERGAALLPARDDPRVRRRAAGGFGRGGRGAAAPRRVLPRLRGARIAAVRQRRAHRVALARGARARRTSAPRSAG